MRAMPTMGQPGCAEDQAAAELCSYNFTSFRFASNDVFNLLTRQDIVKSVRSVFMDGVLKVFFFSPRSKFIIGTAVHNAAKYMWFWWFASVKDACSNCTLQHLMNIFQHVGSFAGSLWPILGKKAIPIRIHLLSIHHSFIASEILLPLMLCYYYSTFYCIFTCLNVAEVLFDLILVIQNIIEP